MVTSVLPFICSPFLRQVVAVFALVAAATARPESVMDIDLEDIHHDQDVDYNLNAFTGSYRWGL